MKKTKPLKIAIEGNIKLGFETDIIEISSEQILPIKPVTAANKQSLKFRQIVSSIKKVGIIEPIIVSRDSSNKNRYILLEGHMRLEALKEIHKEKDEAVFNISCLVSTDDESYTYNKHVNRLPPVQENYMILKAIERGVSKEELAEVLNIDITSIRHKINLLHGICPEAVELLKDKMVSVTVFSILRQMKPTRQIEVAKMMSDTGVYTLAYAKAFLSATTPDQFINPDAVKKPINLNSDQLIRMENELNSLQKDYEIIEENYSTDVFNLTLAKTYLGKLLSNAKVVKYLAGNHPEIFMQFQKTAELSSLQLNSEDLVNALARNY